MTTQERIERVLQAAPQDIDLCPSCDGSGSYWDDQTGQPDEPNGGRMLTCPTCQGDGRVDTSPCIACGAPSYDHEESCELDPGKTAVCSECGERMNPGRDGINNPKGGGLMHWQHAGTVTVTIGRGAS